LPVVRAWPHLPGNAVNFLPQSLSHCRFGEAEENLDLSNCRRDDGLNPPHFAGDTLDMVLAYPEAPPAIARMPKTLEP
jgi:hypothetical protein